MKGFDDAFWEGLAAEIRGHVERQLQPLVSRVEQLEVATKGMSYEGTWSTGRAYTKGQFVTHNGALWHCQRDSHQDRPGDGDKSWVLAVKSGRDARTA